MNKKYALIAVCLLGFVACSTEAVKLDIDNNVRAEGDITGDITVDETWTADKEYFLAGRVSVKEGVTLTIEPGTVIKGRKDPLGWLQVQRGGQLVAEGTALQPIVFTSSQPVGSRQRGDWGGIVLLGRAPNNVGKDVELEGNGGLHGGSIASDSSGSLKYVRIEYAGWELSPDNELNGLTLGSVGSGTSLEYVQIHAGLDDGIEFFGGRVNGRHLVVSGVDDDCFDTDLGYNGAIQWAVCLQEPGHGDNGIEASNNADNMDAAPRSFPKFANVTFVGRGEYSSGKGNGIKFKEGGAGIVDNAIVINFVDGGIDIDDAVDADGNNIDGSFIKIEQSIFYANRFTQQTVASTEGSKTFSQFTSDDDKVDEWLYASNAEHKNQFVDPALRSLSFDNPDLRPAADSPALSCEAPSGFFDNSARYCGAFSNTDWMAGWTVFVDKKATDIIRVNGFVSESTTWTANHIYRLDGRVSVKAGVTLTIEPGTTVLGSKEPLGWLQVRRGARIMARGTRDKPIVFTSAQPAGSRGRGDWGGVVLLGKAENNVGSDVELEGNGGLHGGSNNADNSGVLSFVRIEYAGWELSPDNELNGLTMGSIGSGTEINHVQINQGLDDGVEFFGGTVTADHMVISGVDDDCYDTDQGYRGTIQFAVCIQEPGHGDNGIEASNQGTDIDALPRANPLFANVTFVGRGDFAKGNGIKEKEHTGLTVRNAIVTGFKSGVDVDDALSNSNVDGDGNPIFFSHMIFYGNGTANSTVPSENIHNDDEGAGKFAFDEQVFVAGVPGVQFADPKLANISYTSFDPTPAEGSPAFACADPGAPFKAAAWCGAVSADDNWLSGWTAFDIK